MDKDKLTKILNNGLKLNSITQSQYTDALNLYHKIYETHSAPESGAEHATLAKLINKATGERSNLTLTDNNAVIEAEVLAAEEFIATHPILRTSPADLKCDGRSVEEYLGQMGEMGETVWTPSEVGLWKEYYDFDDFGTPS